MNSNRSWRLVKLLVLALLTACFGASLANAQAARGKFNLPFEARWGQAVLPAGSYAFTMDSHTSLFTITVSGEGRAAMIPATGGHDTSSSPRSELLAVRHGATGTIRSLTLADLGMVLHYQGPGGEPPMVAQAPELIQRLPISMAGK